MGNRFAKPNRRPIKQKYFGTFTIPLHKSSIEGKQGGPCLINRSTQCCGIANDLPRDDCYSLKSNRDFGTRAKKPSRIPVAAWRSNAAPEPRLPNSNNKKTSGLTLQYKESEGCRNSSDRGDEHVSFNDEQNGIAGNVKVRKGISYTIVIGENARNPSPRKPKPKDQQQKNEKAAYGRVDRFQQADINRKRHLENRVQKARLHEIRRQDNNQRRLAQSAEQRQKFLEKEKHREKAVIREEINKRLDLFKNNIKKVRFFGPDKESE